MRCLSCKVGELKLMDYAVRFNRSKGKLVCNKCGHKEVF